MPLFWPLILGERNPARRALKRGLHVRLFRVRLLNAMPFDTAVAVGGLRCFHCRRGTAKIIENGSVEELVFYTVAAKNHPVLILFPRVLILQFRVLLDHDPKEDAKVGVISLSHGFCADISCLTHSFPSPHTLAVEIIPLFFNSE